MIWLDEKWHPAPGYEVAQSAPIKNADGGQEQSLASIIEVKKRQTFLHRRKRACATYMVRTTEGNAYARYLRKDNDMADEDQDGFRVTIRLTGAALTQEICGMLRGLLYVNGNSDGQFKKDAAFKRGVTIEFGTPPMARKFINDVEALFRRRVRRRLHIEQHR